MSTPGYKPSTDRRVHELLDRVIGLPIDRREEILGDDPKLGDEVRAMLDADNTQTLDAFLRLSGKAAGEAEPPGWIGPYRLIELIGEGGMGRVYLAEQEQPVRRRVALKILRFAAAGRRARARFEAERHAMGRLDHPNVGKILEAGTTEDGMPFFAMELIQGSPITTYCDDHALSLKERLRLFADVCRGADHAHRKMLLHRDLKPSNILITEVDGRPTAKIIDFGIAKGLDESLSENMSSSGGRVIGTPQYMSPEALGLGGDVDTRSDVFALGVLLYELLTSVTPWSGGALKEILDRRLSDRPEQPSTRVQALKPETRYEVANLRREDDRSLAKELRRDLDHMVMKAIAQRPEDRYGSAAELADDVDRYLAYRPVSARPPNVGYMLRLLLRRHRLAVVAAAGVLLALALGIVGTSIGMLRARSEAIDAKRARDETQQVVDFLVHTFQASGVESSTATKPPAELTALELLDHGAQRIDRELMDQPLLRAQLEHTFGSVYRQLGQFDAAQKHLESALLLRRDAPGVEPFELAQTHLELSRTRIRGADPESARGHLEQARLLADQVGGQEGLLLRASVLTALGRLERRQGNFEIAEDQARRAVEIYRQHPELTSTRHGAAINNLATILFAQERFAEAEERFRETLDVYRGVLKPGEGRALLAQLMDNLGAAIASQGRLDEAVPLFEQALAERRYFLSADHPRLADSLNNVGRSYLDLGQPERAEELHRQALQIREQALGPNHSRTALSLDNLAYALSVQGRNAEALPLQQRALKIREAAYSPEHPNLIRSLDHLAEMAVESGQLSRARELRTRILSISEQSFEPSDSRLGSAAVELGAVLWRLGNSSAARDLIERGLKNLEAAGESGLDDLGSATRLLAEVGYPQSLSG